MMEEKLKAKEAIERLEKKLRETDNANARMALSYAIGTIQGVFAINCK
jgi:hypothetical protein